MSIITIVGSGVMGSAMCWPATDNGHEVHLVGTHLDREIIDQAKKTHDHIKLNRHLPENVIPYQIEDLDLSIYTVRELFKKRHHSGRYANRYAEARTLNSYEELKKGDYVVHDQYGIGQYVAIESRMVNGIKCDYLKIIYK